VQSKCLRASGIHYLNDTAEFKHAASIVAALLEAPLRHERGPWNDLYGMLREHLPSYTDHVVFVGSFSEAKDKLSQWRAYCSPGGGFSIGFDPGVIERRARDQDFRLLKCEYDPEKQRAICGKMISEACESAHRKSDPATRETTLDDTFFGLFMVTAPALKNPSFEEEHEWRLVRGPFLRLRNIYTRPEEEDDENFIPQLVAKRDDLQFRPGKYAVIPYLNFALADEGARLEVEQIIVGPNPDTLQAKKSIEYFLNNQRVRCKSVDEYSGTYRNW
jgi:hypothetical protein